MENYLWTRSREDQIRVQFQQEAGIERVRFTDIETASKEYGDYLKIAALLVEDKAGGEIRLLHDGTHMVRVNPPGSGIDTDFLPLRRRAAFSRGL